MMRAKILLCPIKHTKDVNIQFRLFCLLVQRGLAASDSLVLTIVVTHNTMRSLVTKQVYDRPRITVVDSGGNKRW